MAKKKASPKKSPPRAAAPAQPSPQMARPQIPQGPSPMQQPQGGPGMQPGMLDMLRHALIQHAMSGGGMPQAMGRPEPPAPSSFTGAAPGQMEQEALKRVLIQRMIQSQRQQQQGPV